MGFFNKSNKVYSLGEAMKLLKMPKYYGYTTVPEGDGFKLVTQAEYDKIIAEQKRVEAGNAFRQQIFDNEIYRKQERNAFREQISGNGIYRRMQARNNDNKYPKYNDWQSAKGYNEDQWVK